MRARSARFVLACLAIAIPVLGFAPQAESHALLRASVPAEGSRLDTAPDYVLLAFTEAPDPALSSISVTDASGSAVSAGPAEPVEGQPKQLRVRLADVSDGTYTVTWRVTSPTDGHTTVGSFSFGVGLFPDSDAPEGGKVPTIAEVIGRWLYDLGAVALLGATAVGLFVSAPRVVVPRALGLAWVASALGVVVAAADQRAGATTPVGDLLLSSTGQRLLAEAGAIGLAGVAVAWFASRRDRRSLATVGAGAGAALLARSLAGHAGTSTVWWFTVGVQWVHLLAVGVWIGGLAWLLVALRQSEAADRRDAARRFSSIAGLALIVVAATGALRAVDEVGAWNRLATTDFGRALLIKLAFVAGLVAVGAASRYRHLPKAKDGNPRGLARSVRAEVVIAVGVLGASAALAGFPPSATVAKAAKTLTTMVTVSGTDDARKVRVVLTVTPAVAGPNAFDATVQDPDSRRAVAADRVTLQFVNGERPDIPPSALRLVLESGGHWRGTSTALSVEGRWSVVAVVDAAGASVRVPMNVEIDTAGAFGTAPPPGSCAPGRPDAAYRVEITSTPDPPKAEGTVFRFAVQRAGQAVTGAEVCLKVDMPSMQHPGVLTIAREVSPGVYEGRLRFTMTGLWAGSVIIGIPGGPSVLLPARFEVT